MSVLCFTGCVAASQLKCRVSLAGRSRPRNIPRPGDSLLRPPSVTTLVLVQPHGVYVAVCPQAQVWHLPKLEGLY